MRNETLQERTETAGATPRGRGVLGITPLRLWHYVCGRCGDAFDGALTGRRPTYCSTRCRVAAWRGREREAGRL